MRFIRLLAPTFFVTIILALCSNCLIAGMNIWTTNGPYEGYYYADATRLAIDPVSDSTIYAGTFGNGIYKTEDRGATWRAVNNGLGYWATVITALAVDPSNRQIVYAGTGYENVSYGVFKSLDGGESWHAINSGLPDYAYITDIVIDPKKPSTLYASTWNGNGGLYKSTNAGAEWTSTLQYGALALAIDPLLSETIYAARYSNELLRSEDGGMNWSTISTGQVPYYSIYSIAIDPTNPATILLGLYGGGVIQTIDGGEHWTECSNGITESHVFCLAIDPLAPSTVYAGTRHGGIFKTTDGGQNWVAINNGLEDHLKGIVEDLVVVPSCDHAVYAAVGAVWSMSLGGHCRPVSRPQ